MSDKFGQVQSPKLKHFADVTHNKEILKSVSAVSNIIQYSSGFCLVAIFAYLITKEARHAYNGSGGTPDRPCNKSSCRSPNAVLTVFCSRSVFDVCRTELHIQDGELSGPKLPLMPDHEMVGIVVAKGEWVEQSAVGQGLGVPWLGRTADIHMSDVSRFPLFHSMMEAHYSLHCGT